MTRAGPGAGLAAAVRGLGRALRDAPRDARRAWSWRAGVWLLAYAVLAAGGPAVLSPDGLEAGAEFLYLALAAVGLNLAAGLAGVPSLAQGAFVGIGAFGAALLISRAGWPAGVATLAGAGIAAAAGALTGMGAVRRSAGVAAVSTWIVAWLVALGLGAFPAWFGGAQGVPATPAPAPDGSLPGGQLTPAGNFEAGLALVAIALLAFARLRRGPAGPGLAVAEEAPDAAAAAGIEPVPRRLGLYAASAAIGGVAGALAVQSAGVADAGEYGPLLSVQLFVAVLIGGRGTVLGPVIGAAVLSAVDPLARALAGATGGEAERLEGILAAALLAVALVAGGSGVAGIAGWLRRARRGPATTAGASGDATARGRGRRRDGGPVVLAAEGVTVRFGGVTALDEASLEARAGEIHALIGPNGSGKTTLLGVLGGTVAPGGGRVRLGELDVTGWSPQARVRGGLGRTLQRTSVSGRLGAAEHVLAGADARRTAGTVRHLLATPGARSEDAGLRDEARRLLARVGLEQRQHAPVGRLNGADARMVSIATALAARPRVLLLDEPAAGLSAASRDRLRALLEALREDGLAIVLVEHDLRLVAAVADVVTVLDAGVVIAAGSPKEVSRDPEVVRAYLGSPSPRAPRRVRRSGDL